MTQQSTAVLPPNMVKPQVHLGVLDLLRGFAALFVVLFHFTGDSHVGGALAKFYSPFMRDTFSWGFLGVDIFFVISGFIIPYSIWNISYTIQDFRKYMIKRVVRICPPAYCIIGFILVQWYIVDRFLHHDAKLISTISLGQVLSNLFFLVPLTQYKWFNGVFWTLAIEFQFYIILGLTFKYLYIKSKLPVFICVGVLLGLACHIPGFGGGNFLTYSPLFFIGGATLLFYKSKINKSAFLVTLLVFFSLSWSSLSLAAGLFGLVTALVIAFVKVQHPLFKFIGTISYSLYLTHFLVGSTVEFFLSKVFSPMTEIQNVIGIAICVIFSCAASYVYFLLIEKPFLKIARRLKA
jgi:peptidoglycan/LPS O-acetylase OafA/YrhL